METMAEQKVFISDPNLISAMETDSSLPNLGENVFETNENIPQEMMIDQLLASDVDNPRKEENNSPKDNEPCYSGSNNENNNSNEERHVESPTTGEGYTFKCVYCDRILSASDSPKLLECLHNCCSSCLNSKLYEHNEATARGQIECPFCSIRCEVTHVIDNQFLLELSSNEESTTSKVQDLKCSSCSDEAPASSYCADCSEFICDNCVQAHQRLKITKDHIIKTKEEGLNEQNSHSAGAAANLFCMVHPHEKLSLFCESCDKLTCRDCQLIEHRDHKYKFTNEIASEAKKSIKEMLSDVGYKRALLTSAMKVIDDRQNLIMEKKQSLVKEITQLVVKLTNTINTRGKQLVAKLTEVCDSKQKTLQEKKQALEQLSKMTDHCISFTQHALDNGSDMALLYSKKTVTDHLKRIKCKRADIPNPEIPVRIHLALDKVPDLIKVMSTIGQIVVDGRVYPSQPTSPAAPVACAAGSPSPGLHQIAASGPGQQQQQRQQSPMSPLPPSQTAPSPGAHYQSPVQSQPQQQSVGRIPGPPSYQQYQNAMQQYNAGMNLAQQQQLCRQLGQQQQQSMGPPGMQPLQMGIGRLQAAQQQQRPQQQAALQRALMPRMAAAAAAGLTQQQQQVSSSTHPQGMLQERSNLRHLLQPGSSAGPVYIQTGPSQYQAIQPQHLQFPQGRFQQAQQQVRFGNGGQSHPVRMMVQQQQQQQQTGGQRGQQVQLQHRPASAGGQPSYPLGVGGTAVGAKWHTPQQSNDATSSNTSRSGMGNHQSMPTINDNFKITLKQQPEHHKNTAPATVTSTIPKTPSPNHIQGRSDTERSLDKFCEESVKDLMATIAKLDSNGVQVLAEGRQKGGSPHVVDSSTGDGGPPKVKSESLDAAASTAGGATASSKDDPNEDWCAVCMDGGELVCCDKCPKVFHQYCHIPNLNVEENETWQCLLCMNFADIPESIMGEKREGELSLKERKIAERIVLELYCQYDISLPFREVISQDNIEYHSIIKNPIALDTIRQKLNWTADNHYRNMEDLVRDVRLMFKNAYTFNPVDSQIYNDAKTLEKFFDEQLEKFLPEYAYETFEEDAIHPPNKKFRRIVTD